MVCDTRFGAFFRAILDRSQSNIWDVAKTEWNITDIEQLDEPETCLCGHFPINEVFTLENQYTGEVVRIGNSCVNKFIRKNKAFEGYKRILKSKMGSATIDLLNFARDKHIITTYDYDFYINIIRKRVLSERQYKWKVDINTKIINYVKNVKEANKPQA